MTTYKQSQINNTLLRAVSPQVFARLAGNMERVDLPLRYVLVGDGVPPDYIYFLEEGLGSVVATSSDEEAIEVGHIGREGASGMHVMLGVSATPGRTFIQVAGSGIRTPTNVFTDAVASDPET